MVAIRQMLVDSSKYSIKCPYTMIPKWITIHNTANDASANNEVSYMRNNNYEVSFHYGVDDIEAVQGLPLNRNGWHAGDGNGEGNRSSIGIEICYSKSGGTRFDKAEVNASQLVAKLLKDYGWGVDRVRTHQSFSGKYCPHRTMDNGWQRFLNMVQSELNKLNGVQQPQQEQPKPSNPVSSSKREITTTYGIHNGYRWLPVIWNDSRINDYAGQSGTTVEAFKCTVSEGKVIYQLHTPKHGWLPEVYGSDNKYSDYAGVIGTEADGLRMRLEGLNSYDIYYRVKLYGSNSYLPWVKNHEDFAGIFNKRIERIQVKVVQR